ncbi:short chain dehydrogenase [Sphaerotilus natans subsp. natans DSM 6575]|uniref:Short chain dehydrogenase n=1 Tax=Sphaerotilus natans subsp. natans DSM 6575 TaxID=1286631 RepID=A0A059KMM6_9BURK|nr:short chain dehydrogenase [Sphaerotilus natans]KDB52711.1 short chain dehydrogenase [Sphaerotilus natans subsp. natans DSM 6575]SIR86899.1 NAD(P)-dependent dehydrogenase, short-chain alcohol dehydrogenase family [Sphaerotilus natans]
MRILHVGASGTLGRAVAETLQARGHTLIRAGRQGGDIAVDITDEASVRAMYAQVGDFGALVATLGRVHFAPLADFSRAQWQIGLDDKLMGQVRLVQMGLAQVREGGSFTLTSGLLNDEPIRQGASAAMVNAALEGFVRAAALEMPRGARINLVSPTLLAESVPVYAPFFPGTAPMAAREVALGYVRSIEGAHTGRVLRMGWSLER